MGFFSWLTADTKDSISNKFSTRGGDPVYLIQPDGKLPIHEREYEGYGVFGGVDAFVWLVHNNVPEEVYKEFQFEQWRMNGIDLDLEGETIIKDVTYKCKFPLKFSFDEDAVYENLAKSETCPHQGYFYEDEDEGDDWDDDEYVGNSYQYNECPDCGNRISNDAVDGEECPNCGHVFWR